MTRGTLGLLALLALLGAGWGLTQPLAKIAVSGGYRPFGLIFWQLALGAAILGAITRLRGERLPLGGAHLRLYALVALFGTVLPNSASYAAAAKLPSGLLSILISSVPMFAFPIALMLGNDRFSAPRFLGLLFGLGGVLLIVGPEASLPEAATAAFVPLALVAPFFYGLEGNLVAKWGTYGASPVQTLYGASVIGLAMALPMAVVSGQFIDPRPPWGLPDAALALSATIHVFVYTGYVWLVGRAGATFAAQVSYFVTGFGVFWAMALLGEAYSGWVWGAMGMMVVGLFLVQPRPRDGLAVPLGTRSIGSERPGSERSGHC